MHFTVSVFSEEPYGFEELLAPFQENSMGDCPEEYLEFKSVEEECLKEYLEEKSEGVIMPDGRVLSEYSKEFDMVLPLGKPFREFGYDYSRLPQGQSVHRKIPENLEIKEVSFKELYSTFGAFMEDYHGYSKRDNKAGAYGYWENPNAKWDWYQLGGRWKGMLLVKDSAREYAIGKPGVFGENIDIIDVPGYKWVDVAKIKDIEWEKMAEIARQNAEKNWEEAHKRLESGEFDKMYMDYIYGISKKDTKESYIERNEKFGTYTVLTSDGKWHEKGDINDFEKKYFDNFIKDADKELYLSIVDCHI